MTVDKDQNREFDRYLDKFDNNNKNIPYYQG
jgi:hypothetical protein